MDKSIDLSPEALNHIKELAQKATPGPWAYTGLASSNGSYRNGHIHQEGRDGNECVIVSLNSMANPRCLEDALFISWFHPGIALAMCAELERLRADVARLEKEADWLAQCAANDGWHGVRVSPDFIRAEARKAVEEQCKK